jgi:hypothetical protein
MPIFVATLGMEYAIQEGVFLWTILEPSQTIKKRILSEMIWKR